MASFSSAPIVCLLFGCCPTAIPWRVISIVVDSIKSFTLGASTHVGKKLFVFAPSTADANTSAPVLIISRIVRILASLTHGRPTPIFCRDLAIPRICFTMSKMKAPIYIAMEAAARLCVPLGQIKIKNRNLLSTIAATNPFSARMLIALIALQYDKSTKPLTYTNPIWSGHRSLHERLLCQVATGCLPGRCAF